MALSALLISLQSTSAIASAAVSQYGLRQPMLAVLVGKPPRSSSSLVLRRRKTEEAPEVVQRVVAAIDTATSLLLLGPVCVVQGNTV